MPVHNARAFLPQSIESILRQLFQDFEFVILDDASTDGSREILEHWAQTDSRIRLFHSSECSGLSRSSNRVVSECRTPIIARMDADDISHPARLLMQFKVLNEEPDVVAVGTLSTGIDVAGRAVRPRDRWRIVRRSEYIPFPHGSSMFRKSCFDEVGGYSENLKRGEDQELFHRMAKKGRIVTLPNALYHYRYHTENSTLHENARALKQDLNGQTVEALYMLGAMRLWAGHKPMNLRDVLANKSVKLNTQSLVTLASSSWGNVHPASLRGLLRLLIRTRDMIAGMQIKEGRAYEWRSK